MSAYFQFRWEQEGEFAFACHYELVIPLGENDIRREIWEDGVQIGERDKLVIAMSEYPTRRTGGGIPCVERETGYYYFDAPYRDGAHAKWDSATMGNIPIQVIAVDGTVIEDDRE